MASQVEYNNLIVGLDIGTSKVVAIVGQILQDGSFSIQGLGCKESVGLKRGVVVNIDSTVNAINGAIEEAELMTGYKIESVYVGIAGQHINSMNSDGVVAVSDKEVNQTDIDRVLDAAQAVEGISGQHFLHIIPQEFLIDSQEGVKHPLGMTGVRLEAKVHIVTCAVNAAKNIENCIIRCGLKVNKIILEQLASSESVLSDGEKDLGVCLVDIGGGTTDIAIFTGGSIQHTAVIPIAGDQVTNDIATGLLTSMRSAEALKVKYASAVISNTNENDTIRVIDIGDRPEKTIDRRFLAEIVEARYAELFRLILEEIYRFGFENSIPAGIVLTGGSSQVEGAVELAEDIFNLPVRIGIPQISNSINLVKNPMYATSVGLLNYAVRDHENKEYLRKKNIQKNIWYRLKRYLQLNL